MTPKDALDIVFLDPDTGIEMTIRAYFKLMLSTIFDEGESFSSKHPFGKSGWESNLEYPLVKAGCIAGSVDDDDPDDHWPFGVNYREYCEYIQHMIAEL